MTEPMSREQVLARIQQEIAEQRDAAQHELDPVKRDRMLRHSRCAGAAPSHRGLARAYGSSTRPGDRRRGLTVQ
jgi:hypothetical protein